MSHRHNVDSHLFGLKPDDRQSDHIENDSVDEVGVSYIISQLPMRQSAVDETVAAQIRCSETIR
jgi:hypothetical protein